MKKIKKEVVERRLKDKGLQEMVKKEKETQDAVFKILKKVKPGARKKFRKMLEKKFPDKDFSFFDEIEKRDDE